MSPFVILTRHFFRRLFTNDLVSFEEGMQQKTIAMVSILAVLYGYFGFGLMSKYMFLPDRGISWVEKSYYLYMVMTVIGLVTVIAWDALFPDRRDYLTLSPLPVRTRTLVGSKLASLFLFVGLFSLATAPFSAFWFVMILPQWHSPSLWYGLRFIFAHFASCLAAGSFIFFAIMLLAGLLMVLLGRRVYGILSPYLRGLLLTALMVQMMMFFIQSVSTYHLLASVPAMKGSGSVRLYLFPPLWFTGLYETILGSNDPVFRKLAGHGIASLAILALLTLGIIFLRYTAFAGRTGESGKGRRRIWRRIGFLKDVFAFAFLRDRVDRAVFGFFGNTLRRSGLQKARVIFYLSVSLGVALILLAWAAPRIRVHMVPERTLLSLPFLLAFFLLAGLRSAAELPSASRARWVFELTEIKERHRYGIGLRKGIFFWTLLPMGLLTFAGFGFLWSWKESLLFSLFFLAIACLLMEVVFFKYRKIPFACDSFPGRARMHVLWLAYLAAFLFFINVPPLLALELRRTRTGYPLFFLFALAALMGFRIVGKRFGEKNALIYEEEPEPVMITLDAGE